MTTYSYSHEEAKHQSRVRALTLCIPLAAAGVILVVGTYITVPGMTLNELLSSILTVLVVGGAVALLQILGLAKSVPSLKITVDSDRVTKTQKGTQDTTILRSEVQQIVEIPKTGLRIDSNVGGGYIFIPRELDRFGELRSSLEQWFPIRPEVSRLPRVVAAIVLPPLLILLLLLFRSTRRLGLILVVVGLGVTVAAQIVQGVRHYLGKREVRER